MDTQQSCCLALGGCSLTLEVKFTSYSPSSKLQPTVSPSLLPKIFLVEFKVQKPPEQISEILLYNGISTFTYALPPALTVSLAFLMAIFCELTFSLGISVSRFLSPWTALPHSTRCRQQFCLAWERLKSSAPHNPAGFAFWLLCLFVWFLRQCFTL